MLNSATSQQNTAQSEYNSGAYSSAQTDASAAQSSAVQANSNFQAAGAGAQSCIQQQQQAAQQQAQQNQAEQEKIQSATSAVNNAKTTVQTVNDLITNVVTPMKLSSSDGAALLSSANDYLTLAQGSLNSGDASLTESNAGLANSKAQAALLAYQKISEEALLSETKSGISGVGLVQQKIDSYGLSQTTQPVNQTIQQAFSLLQKGDYAQALQTLKTAESQTKQLQASVDSDAAKIDGARTQGQYLAIGGAILLAIILGLIYFFIKRIKITSNKGEKVQTTTKEKNCPKCGTSNPHGAKHCHNCGAKL